MSLDLLKSFDWTTKLTKEIDTIFKLSDILNFNLHFFYVTKYTKLQMRIFSFMHLIAC